MKLATPFTDEWTLPVSCAKGSRQSSRDVVNSDRRKSSRRSSSIQSVAPLSARIASPRGFDREQNVRSLRGRTGQDYTVQQPADRHAEAEYTWASWLRRPLSGYGVHFFLNAFELGKLQGNMLVELSGRAKACTNGYKSSFDKGLQNDVTTSLERLNEAQHREFAPLTSEVGLRMPEEPDPRDKESKKDDPDYAAKLAVYNPFCFE